MVRRSNPQTLAHEGGTFLRAIGTRWEFGRYDSEGAWTPQGSYLCLASAIETLRRTFGRPYAPNTWTEVA